ncbi:MAG: hypothetical protein IJS82_03315 [Paludibacteraceae bacterium]|nr:hypothetical protein [Paludibacteraceae bacterium]
MLFLFLLLAECKNPSEHECGRFFSAPWEIGINLVASFFAFIIAYEIVIAISKNLQKFEDEIKASYLNSNLQPQYNPKGKNENGYRKDFILHKDSGRFIVYVNDLYRQLRNHSNHLYFSDDKDSHFEPDLYIMMHVGTLYGAHATSKTVSELTVRLNDFHDDKNKDKKAIAYTTRSTYLAHLLTNRAIDYPLENDLTVRKIYENTEELTPLNRSKLSNHIGVNALVFLKENENDTNPILILPKRGKDATVAKNGVTASIATRLNLKAYEPLFKESKEVDEHTISQACVVDNLTSALMIDEQYKDEMRDKMKAELHFLGLSRDPYEGGKPTLFYYINLYMTQEEFISKLNPKYKPDGIDAVQELLYVKWENVGITTWEEKIQKRDANPNAKPLTDSERLIMEDKEYDKSRLLLKKPDHYKYSKKEKRYTFTTDEKAQQFIFEQNLIANLWFYVNKDKKKINEIQS